MPRRATPRQAPGQTTSTPTPGAGTATAEKPRVVTWSAPDAPAPTLPQATWDGTCTEMPIAYPMMRGDYDERGRPAGPPRIVGLGDTVVFRAAYDERLGVWVGPEATHVEDLFRSGQIHGSEAQRQRAAQTAAMERERGCWPSGDGKPALRPELRERTKEQVQREWERVLAGGWEELRRIEGQESRADRQDNAAAVRELAEAIKTGRGPETIDPEVLAKGIALALAALSESGHGPVFAGSQAAGSHMKRVRAAEQPRGGAAQPEPTVE